MKLLVLTFTVFLLGCDNFFDEEQELKKSYNITLYSANGTPIKTWHGQGEVRGWLEDNFTVFYHEDVKYYISGTIVVEEHK